MFHLFDRVYLDHHANLNSKHTLLILSKDSGPHPLSKALNRQFENIESFESFLSQHHEGDIELFWTDLTRKDPNKRFILFCDQVLFLELMIQFLKSLYSSENNHHLFFIYNLYRKDYQLKSMITHVRGEPRVLSNLDLFPNYTFEEFCNLANGLPVSSILQSLSKEKVSYEHVLGAHLNEPEDMNFEDAIKKKVLFFGWRTFCNEINGLKSEISRSLTNIHLVFPGLKYDENENPLDYCKAHPELSWIFDPMIKPEFANHIKKTYASYFFPRIQLYLFRQQLQDFFGDNYHFDALKPEGDINRINYLFNSDFKKILELDMKRGLGSSFFKGETFFNTNHLLINHLYNLRLENNSEKLKPFKLS
ncbi:MAG: hypothetical protein ACK5V3_16580 [Bdellovibrionales bacterium]